MPKLIDLTGEIFGILTVLRREGRNTYSATWQCKCKCGNEKIVTAMNLRNGHTASCGCLTSLLKSQAVRSHGCKSKYSSPLQLRAHSAWSAMRRRCNDRKFISYPAYGGRGIRVCKRWLHDFPAFLSDVGLPPTPKHTIERRDNNRNYTPKNCRWATQREQTRNTRKTVYVTIDGITKPLWQWVESTGLKYHCVRSRIRRGLEGRDLIAA